MRKLLLRSAAFMLLLTAATPSHAQSFFNLYQSIYAQASDALRFQADVSPEIMEYVIRVMGERRRNPLQISEEDVRNAMRGLQTEACRRPAGEEIAGEECNKFVADIRYLVETEKQTQQFADDLLALANSSELTASDEHHRPVSFGQNTAAFVSIWTGTGAQMTPWPEEADDAFDNLVSALRSEEQDLDAIVLRYHFGLLRMTREEEAGFTALTQYGSATRSALEELAQALRINADNIGKPELAEYATPNLSGIPNLALWAREDDIGLSWIYPISIPRIDIAVPSEYPVFYPNGENLSYPFRYKADALPDLPDDVREKLKSPLCSRVSGRYGYLCRSVEEQPGNCPDAGDTNEFSIRLMICDEQEQTVNPGPDVCSDPDLLEKLHISRDGNEISVARGQVPPVCTPGTETTFESSFVTNACFTGLCLKQSMSGHSLIGGRSPIAQMESTAPYLSCILPDPKLGMLSEMPPVSATVIPQYLGHELVAMFDREMCSQTGNSPAISTLCQYRASRRLALPLQTLPLNYLWNDEQFARSVRAQDSLRAAAPSIGLQYGINQAVPMYEKMVLSLSQGIDAIAELFLELKDAPLSSATCPWSGELCTTECFDGVDNDGDGDKDLSDKGCRGAQDVSERYGCSDGLDNDEDGLVDNDDDGCESATDHTE